MADPEAYSCRRLRESFEEAFRRARQAKAGAVLILSSPAFGAHTRRLAELTLQHRLPAISLFRLFVESGGLMTYGPGGRELYRQEGRLLASVLKGATPADLPIERPAKIELIVNQRTAKALGLTLTPAITTRADHVVD